MAPFPAIFVRESFAPGSDSDHKESRSYGTNLQDPPLEDLVPLFSRELLGVLDEALIPGGEGAVPVGYTGGSPAGGGYSYNPGVLLGPPAGGARPPPGAPAAPVHDPAVDTTPGAMPEGQAGPPGPGIWENNKYIIMGVVGLAVLGGGGYYGWTWWKKKQAK